jgi:conjugal transfer pilus assembly protein TraI
MPETIDGGKPKKNQASQQLRLPIDPAPPVTDQHRIPAQLSFAIPSFQLNAPSGMNQTVCAALTQIIETLNRGGPNSAARTVASGIFIPFDEFERRGVGIVQVMGELQKAKMHVPPDGAGSASFTCDFRGQQKPGVLLHPRFVNGLDPADFDIPKEGA